jgi:hypothetical protein
LSREVRHLRSTVAAAVTAMLAARFADEPDGASKPPPGEARTGAMLDALHLAPHQRAGAARVAALL